MAKQQASKSGKKSQVESAPVIEAAAAIDTAAVIDSAAGVGEEKTEPRDENLEPGVVIENPGFRLPKLVKGVRGAVANLWRANLGAAILIESNIVKGFNTLVEEGEAFQKASKNNKAGKAAANVVASASGVRTKAVDKIHKIEHRIDEGVNNTLHWIGMPSRNDFTEMSNKVNELSESLTVLTRQLKENLNAESEVH